MQWKVSPGFWLLLGVLYYLDEGVGVLPWGLLACAVHEAGHWLAARMYGGRLEAVHLTAVGAEMSVGYPKELSYGGDTMVAMAGPACNLILGGAAWLAKLPILSILSLGVGAFNLLPIYPMDGARILGNILAPLMGPVMAERWVTVISAVAVGGLLGIGTSMMGSCTNLTLLLTTLWLFWGIVRKGTLKWWQEKKEKKGGKGLRSC